MSKLLVIYVSTTTSNADTIVGIYAFSSSVAIPSFTTLEMVLKNGIPFTFTTSMPIITVG